MTLRELWWLACGVYDRELSGRAFWMGQFGTHPTPEQMLEMHPLRMREKAKPKEVKGETSSEPKAMTAAEQALFDELTRG